MFVGKKQLIEGMDKALVGMCVNQRSLVKIPPQLAYGKQGYGTFLYHFSLKRRRGSWWLPDRPCRKSSGGLHRLGSSFCVRFKQKQLFMKHD